jgi:hypothetical protein
LGKVQTDNRQKMDRKWTKTGQLPKIRRFCIDDPGLLLVLMIEHIHRRDSLSLFVFRKRR